MQASVARCYAGSNGLRNLNDLNDKRIVAQEVFKTLNRAMVDPTIVFFPSFDHIQNPTLRSVTQSLLDVNVDNKYGKAKLVNPGKSSVSMSLPITVVLTELFCQKSRIRWDCDGRTLKQLQDWVNGNE